MFFPEKRKTRFKPIPKVEIMDRHKEWTTILYQAILRKGRITSKPSGKRWHTMFAMLDQEVGKPKRIKQVLNWYVQNINNQYSPIVKSAASFREKFLQIEEVMERHQKDNVEIEPETLEMISRYPLNNYGWDESKQDLFPKAAQQSINNFKIVHKALLSIKKHHKEYAYECKYLIEQYITPDWEMDLSAWLDYHWNRLANWRGWNGNPMSVVFDVFKPSFVKTFVFIWCIGNNLLLENQAFTLLELLQNEVRKQIRQG